MASPLRRAMSPRLELLAREQDGVLSRRQLTDLCLGYRTVQREDRAGRWAVHGRAVVLHRGPLTTRQRRWIAVINTGPAAALAGLTACEELGLTGFGTPTIHLLSPRDTRATPILGVRVHRSRRFGPEDLYPARHLPTVRIDRGLIDGASWTPLPRRAAAIVLAGIQQRLTLPARLRDQLAAAGPIRHCRLLRGVIDDAEGGVHALSELDFAILCRNYGLPTPERQTRRKDSTGKVRYLDAPMRCRDGSIVNIEIDGAAHFNVINAWDDMIRDIDLLARGEPTIRVPSAIVRAEPARVADIIRHLLEAPWRRP